MNPMISELRGIKLCRYAQSVGLAPGGFHTAHKKLVGWRPDKVTVKGKAQAGLMLDRLALLGHEGDPLPYDLELFPIGDRDAARIRIKLPWSTPKGLVHNETWEVFQATGSTVTVALLRAACYAAHHLVAHMN